MSAMIDLTGKRFGKWTVLHRDIEKKSSNVYWVCQCDCGTVKSVNGTTLRRGMSASCGCDSGRLYSEKKMHNLTGLQFGKLTVLGRLPHEPHKPLRWECQCDCGNIVYIKTANIYKQRSCGCAGRETRKKNFLDKAERFGSSKDRLYRVWLGMRYRCFYQKDKYYMDYGGRGITICDEWLGPEGYTNFRLWAYQNGYDDTASFQQCTLDRIDVNGNYEPTNCRWVDIKSQANNKRNTPYYTIGDITKSLSEWCDTFGVSHSLVSSRVRRGWDIERALTQPKRKISKP